MKIKIEREYRPLTDDEIDAILDCKHDATNLSIETEIKSIQEMDRAFFLMLEMNQLNKEAA
jgi:hypothetical protein